MICFSAVIPVFLLKPHNWGGTAQSPKPAWPSFDSLPSESIHFLWLLIKFQAHLLAACCPDIPCQVVIQSLLEWSLNDEPGIGIGVGAAPEELIFLGFIRTLDILELSIATCYPVAKIAFKVFELLVPQLFGHNIGNHVTIATVSQFGFLLENAFVFKMISNIDVVRPLRSMIRFWASATRAWLS